MRQPPLCLLLPIFLLSLTASAASFNCKAAKSPREKTVCANPDLSSLNSKLVDTYATALSKLSPTSAALVQTDQRAWLAFLDKVCSAQNPEAGHADTCLEASYKTRLDQLTSGLTQVNGMRFYTRTHFVFVPSKSRRTDRVGDDPGFGEGEFAWPQIDRPNADQTAWNKAAYQAAVKAEAVNTDGEPRSMDAAVDDSGYVYGFYTLVAANSRLVDVDFVRSTYGWGAAHSLRDQESFLWWLTLRRSVTDQDVLRAETDWKHQLVAPALAKLKLDTGENHLGGDEDDARIDAADGLASIDDWDLTAEGLTITYGQYAFGGRHSVMPRAIFTWDDLAPYIQPSLAPASLPSRLP